jgi:hypothetical protein
VFEKDNILRRVQVIFNGRETVETWKVDTFFGEQKQSYWIVPQSTKLLKQSVEINKTTNTMERQAKKYIIVGYTKSKWG